MPRVITITSPRISPRIRGRVSSSCSLWSTGHLCSAGGERGEGGTWLRRCRAELRPRRFPVTAPRRTERPQPPAEPWGENQLLWSKVESVTTQGCRERVHLSNQPTHWKNTFMPISSALTATHRRPRWGRGSQSPSFLSD